MDQSYLSTILYIGLLGMLCGSAVSKYCREISMVVLKLFNLQCTQVYLIVLLSREN